MIFLNLTNELIAKTAVHYEKTIAVLMDERPGLDVNAAEKIITFLQDNGYYVHRITADELCEKNKATLGFFLLIPHACAVPAPCAEAIKLYWEQGGQVITLGGSLFSKWIDRVDGKKWQELELKNTEFDAAYSEKTSPIVIEGIVPSYKTYHYNHAKKFSVADNQFFVDTAISTEDELKFVCPVARSRGDGYNCEHNYRYIPLVKIDGEGGRDNGNRGAAAFIMLSNTKGHLPLTNGNRPGSVSSTTFGSAIGSIGITEQDIMSIKGIDNVLLSMIKAMERGLYIFEAGANQPIYDNDEKPVIGAKLLNLSQDFEDVTVRFTISKNGETVFTRVEDILSTPRAFCEVSFNWDDYRKDDYDISVELIHNGKTVDIVKQSITTYEHVHSNNKDDFVSVDGDNFILNKKPWYSWGMNYWPLYYPSYERSEYWMGWFDKSNYFPNEVEADIKMMEELGINTLYIRFDADILGRSIPQIKDFITRCRKHNMKLSISYPNVTCPLNYSGKAYRKFIEVLDIAEDPIIFGHDIAWEIGYQLLLDFYRSYWDEPWYNWLLEQYGTIDNAESDFKCKIDRAEDGRIISPPINEFSNDGAWRIKIAAYRRFIDDHMSRIWNPAVRDLRKIVPNHLIAYRKGPNQPQAVSFTINNKHVDYTSPEGYEVTHDDYGYHVSCANSMVLNLLSGNKPIVWSEYGLSLTGLKWTELIWDHEKQEPFPYRIEKNTSYIEQYMKMFKRMRVNGSAPWWWCGGFRMVEMSDCGYCGPDGVLRPYGQLYADNGNWFKSQGEKAEADIKVIVDPDMNAGGYNYVCDQVLWKEHKKAEESGKTICAITEATGTTTATVPLIAIGNVPFNGKNPPKYLNAEFNFITLTDVSGNTIEVQKGTTLTVNPGKYMLYASVGNLLEPTWISGETGTDGAVFLESCKDSDINIKMPIKQNVEFLQDADISGEITLNAGKQHVSLRMCVENKAVFGEKFEFDIITK